MPTGIIWPCSHIVFSQGVVNDRHLLSGKMRYNDNTNSSSLAPCLKIRINWSMVRGISSGVRAAISCSVKKYFRCIGIKHASREHVSYVQYRSVFSNIVAHGKVLQSYTRCVGHLCFHRLRFHRLCFTSTASTTGQTWHGVTLCECCVKAIPLWMLLTNNAFTSFFFFCEFMSWLCKDVCDLWMFQEGL